ncbi:sigma-70 family RNA polymerase sigma factor [Nocardioides sp. WV_118_6]|uniref:RNA polymerase sigma factor n=1 Tax=Nocardioides simplex TaxID=2045 RepID=UPI0021503930|nr:sigma-70 family RNA polymerase sigma factor [Pimelobacter simplex]UUW90369.1 sigma-70 family RNA polymerase sigma factor [Pimelobacter simplex]UUW94199.1 sigma-70 family RNA polymerase sigma factor [Pimelobacter simplex]
MPEVSPSDAVVEVWRREAPLLIAALTRLTRDVSLAEDLAQDAFVTALEQWPDTGVPANPAAWLMTTAKRRAIDAFRRADTLRRKTEELERTAGEADPMPDLDAHVDHIEDDVLRLIFLCCHPALTPESRAALTLRMVGGLTTTEIARGFLVPDATMGQRISRAKRTLTASGAQLEMPTGADRTARLDDVMAVVYLVFNEGYAATSGDEWVRPDLAAEAIRLARMLAELAPDEPEVHGLQALLELQGSRLSARTDAAGRPVLLDDQDRDRWDALLIRRGLAALGRAEAIATRGVPIGRYVVQAAIAAEHAKATTPSDTDWPRIARMYDVLAQAAPGPVVEVNRAVAHGRAAGPDAGLAVLAALPPDALPDSPLVPSVRGDLLARAGRADEAAAEFAEAARRTRNAGERALLEQRAAAGRLT